MLGHYERGNCRLCEDPRLEKVIEFGSVPVAGAFVDAAHRESQELYPLDIWRCRASGCGHFQLNDVVDPKILFPQDYSYFSGKSKEIREHFKEYSLQVCRRFGLDKNSFVVDVGSNDGTLLEFFRRGGVGRVLGVDPAGDLASYANKNGIETLPEMYNMTIAERIKRERGEADVVTANHVFAHTDDMIGMARAVRELMNEKGVFTFEVSYFPDVLDKMLLGTVIHEHLCYHTVQPLDAFLKRQNMELIDVQRTPIQGGSITCTAQALNGPHQKSKIINEMIWAEHDRGLYDENPVVDFNDRLASTRKKTIELVKKITRDGKTIAGFGAARGGTLLNYYFELGEYMQFIVDDDPSKQGLYSPGQHVPVVPVKRMYEDKRPDYVAVLAWVHTKPIVQKHRKFLDEGGKFFTFLPEVQVIDRENVESYLRS